MIKAKTHEEIEEGILDDDAAYVEKTQHKILVITLLQPRAKPKKNNIRTVTVA
jgi:hypothetical protein